MVLDTFHALPHTLHVILARLNPFEQGIFHAEQNVLFFIHFGFERGQPVIYRGHLPLDMADTGLDAPDLAFHYIQPSFYTVKPLVHDIKSLVQAEH